MKIYDSKRGSVRSYEVVDFWLDLPEDKKLQIPYDDYYLILKEYLYTYFSDLYINFKRTHYHFLGGRMLMVKRYYNEVVPKTVISWYWKTPPSENIYRNMKFKKTLNHLTDKFLAGLEAMWYRDNDIDELPDSLYLHMKERKANTKYYDWKQH